MEAGKGTQFVKEIEALSPSGGGDCPELAFRGITDALNEGPQSGSPLYVFTDATAKDYDDYYDKAMVAATSQGTSVYIFFTGGGCYKSSSKPYQDLASETCGQMFKIPKNSKDLATMSNITKSLLHVASCNMRSGGGLFGRKKRSGSSEYKLFFDDVMEKVVVSVTTQNTGARIDLKDPRGIPVSGSGKIILDRGAIFEIDNHRPGSWKLIVSSGAGKHSYVIKASSKTNLDFDFVFVIPRKRMSPLPISHPLIGK